LFAQKAVKAHPLKEGVRLLISVVQPARPARIDPKYRGEPIRDGLLRELFIWV
jgi:hypothetical protein